MFFFFIKVEAVNKRTGALYVFSCNRWLSADKDDGKIDRILYLDLNRSSRLEIPIKHNEPVEKEPEESEKEPEESEKDEVEEFEKDDDEEEEEETSNLIFIYFFLRHFKAVIFLKRLSK